MLPALHATTGAAIDQLFWVIFWITAAVFIAVELCLLTFIVIYRKRPGRTASYMHGSTPVEIVWTLIPALIFVGLGIASQRVWTQVKQRVPADALHVHVTGEQFAWNVRYAGPDGQFGTGDDIEQINQMHIPVHRPVAVTLTSKDVIHSFFLPYHRVKQDAVPGLTSRIWFEPTHTGTYDIVCAELCGLGHYRMKGYLTVESDEDFHVWLAGKTTEKQ
jgi:cytochrome c oxidase subunit II